MAENLLKKPAKGILKTSSSFDHAETNKNAQDIKWDEMNILQTLHPPDKDYGHMKIDEPKTPYSYYEENASEETARGQDTLDAELLAKKINLSAKTPPKALIEAESEEEEEEEEETEEERAQRTAFEYKRKMHYNEFYAVKLARKLLAEECEEEEEEDENVTKDSLCCEEDISKDSTVCMKDEENSKDSIGEMQAN